MVAAKTAAKKNFFTMELALSVVFSGFDHDSGKAYSKNAWLSSTGSRLRLPECTVLRTRATRTGRLYVTSNYPWSASDPKIGRASCRERVWMSVGAGACMDKQTGSVAVW